MNTNTDISQLPNETLARLFFRRLWQGYDSGGVSVGRSLRSDLVEVYLALHVLEEDDNYPLGLREFADEAGKRQPLISKQILFGDLSRLDIIPSHEIGLLCIEGLRVWYNLHADERTNDGYSANIWECRFIEAVCRIMPIPLFPDITSDDEIILLTRTGEERVRMSHDTSRTWYGS
jgi:hypothetical protein